jgi:hypothetical protein
MKRMKNLFLFFIGIFLVFGLMAQTPQAFKYQAVARDASGNVLANKMVSFRISILPVSTASGAVYSETHSKSTNAFGLIDLEIGNGSNVLGSISAIDWAANIYFIKIEMDPSGGSSYQQMGTSQLLSVPYALHARTVEIDQVDDADNDPANEIQTLDLNGYELTLSKEGGSVILPKPPEGDKWGDQVVQTNISISGNGTNDFPLKVVDDVISPSWSNVRNKPAGFDDNIDNDMDADSDPANEIQSLVLVGNQLSLTPGDGTAVTLPTPEGGDNWGTQSAITDATLSGTGTSTSPLKIAAQRAANGQTLKWNGTSWLPGDDLTGTNLWTQSGSNIYFNTGNVGIGTAAPAALFHVDGTGNSNGGSVLFKGELDLDSPSNPPVTGAGTRMMWYTPKAAFRAGAVVGAQWDKTNMGYFSTAFGYSCMALGDYSFASGSYSNASADYSFAFGNGSHATSNSAVAIGNSADATAQYSLATGYSTTASGNYSSAFNSGSTASGTASAAFGYQCTASGSYSFASGFSSTASGLGSMAMGLNNTSSLNYSTAMGSNTTASGLYSFTCGYSTTAPSLCEVAVGLYNTTYAGNPTSLIATDRIFVVGNGTGSSERNNAITVLKNGCTGIGVDAPSYTLAVSGTAAKTGGGSWTNLSDRRLKDIQGEYSKGLNEIVALQPVMFTYKKDNSLQLESDKQQIGFVAQEVQTIFPEAVSENSSGYLDFNMHPVNVALVNAVKELKAENDKLKATIVEILSRMANLEEQLQVSATK